MINDHHTFFKSLLRFFTFFIILVLENAKHAFLRILELTNALFKVELSVVGTMKYVQNQNWRSSKMVVMMMVMVMVKKHHTHNDGILRANGQWINRLRDSNADKVVSHFCAGRQSQSHVYKRDKSAETKFGPNPNFFHDSL